MGVSLDTYTHNHIIIPHIGVTMGAHARVTCALFLFVA